jgi:putative DNA primase/helicase
MTDPFAPIGGNTAQPGPASRVKWVAVVPVPADAPAPPGTHPKLGQPTACWTYADATGAVLGHVLRFDLPGGDKQFRPLTWRRPEADGSPMWRPMWRWESWPEPRPLYGLAELAESPAAPVLVTEGEKAADAARRLLPALVVVTSPNGSKAAGGADWSPLRGRTVTIWPDADTAGLEYARTVAEKVAAAGAVSVAIVSPPQSCAVGWDAADAMAEGWDTVRATALVAGAKSIDTTAAKKNTTASSSSTSSPDQKAAGGDRRRTPQRDQLIGCCEFVDLWHDANRSAYASFPVNGHVEHWPIRSRDFRMWLSDQFYMTTGGAIGGQALEDGIRILEARAVNHGPQFDPFIRIGEDAGRLYLDLCDNQWRAIEINNTAWRIVEKPPLKMIRAPAMRPIATPVAGGMIEELRQFVNVKTDADFMLTVAWLVAALRNKGPFPVLAVGGEQGSGKSVVSRMLRLLIDPAAAPIRAVPKDDRDLVVSASNSWLLVFDNLSAVPGWLSDALCRLATGSGFATRMLHTDNSEMIFEAARPIILNGIPSLTDRADLADRSVTIHLATIPEDRRKPEDELWAEFEEARPRITGALLDAVSAALRNVGEIKLERSPRMADFAKWITAAEPGLGWEPGAFLDAYDENRRNVSETAFEADSVAVAITNFIVTEKSDGWEGTPTELLGELNNRTADGIRKARSWPLTPQALGNRVDRIAPLLRGKGFTIERRHSTRRTIIIVPPKF